MGSHEDIEALIRRAKAGDRGALDEFARRCQEHVRGIAAHKLGTQLREKLEVDDIVQSSLRRVTEALDEFEFRSLEEWRRWLREIVDHTIVDANRRLHCQKRCPEGLVSIRAPGTDSSSSGVEPESPDPGPATQVSRKEEWEQLLATLSRLPDDHRKAIRLYHLEGRTLAEVAKELGRSEKAVESLLARARETMRKGAARQ